MAIAYQRLVIIDKKTEAEFITLSEYFRGTSQLMTVLGIFECTSQYFRAAIAAVI